MDQIGQSKKQWFRDYLMGYTAPLILGIIIITSSFDTLTAFVRLTGHHGAGLYGRDLLASLPPHSALSTGSIDPLSSLLYLQWCENCRRDVVIVSRNRWFKPAYWQSLSVSNPALGKLVGKINNYPVYQYFLASQIPHQRIFWEGIDTERFSQVNTVPHEFVFEVTAAHSSSFADQDHFARLSEKTAFDFYIKHANPLGKAVISNTLFNFSLYFLNQQQIPEARSLLKKAIKANCLNEKAVSNYIVCLVVENELEPVEKLFRSALKVHSYSSDLNYNYAVFLVRMDRREEAEYYFKRSAMLQPHNGARWRSYAEILQELGREKEAVEARQKAYRCERTNP